MPSYDGRLRLTIRVWKPRPRELAHVPGLLVIASLIVGGTSWMVPEGLVWQRFLHFNPFGRTAGWQGSSCHGRR